jgi:hypothetical protein
MRFVVTAADNALKMRHRNTPLSFVARKVDPKEPSEKMWPACSHKTKNKSKEVVIHANLLFAFHLYKRMNVLNVSRQMHHHPE